MRVDVNLQDVDIDQCSTSGWFAGTHRCNLTSMEVSPPHAINLYMYIYSHFTALILDASHEVDVILRALYYDCIAENGEQSEQMQT